MNRITKIAPTIASLLSIPSFTDESAIEEIASLGKRRRVLMYNPDAVAWWIYEKYHSLFAPVLADAKEVFRMQSVMPSVTPVCFGSIYSGLMPEEHGIQTYAKPVLTCETIFDAAIKAGLKPAICSTGTDSISMIFRERGMDYFIVDTPDEANEQAKKLIAEDRHDLIVVYNGNYDSTMHRWGPEAGESLDALRHNIASYRSLLGCAKAAWGSDWAAAFVTDHGCHEIDGGCGSHGLDMPEDMEVVHIWHTGENVK